MSEYTDIIAPFKEIRGGIIEAFHAIQETYRQIPPTALKEIAAAFDMTEAEVYGIASFYNYFSFYQQGKYVIMICRSAPCHIAGSEEIIKTLERTLGIPMGGTTEDGKFSLVWAECIGQCQDAPALMLGKEILTGIKAKGIRERVLALMEVKADD